MALYLCGGACGEGAGEVPPQTAETQRKVAVSTSQHPLMSGGQPASEHSRDRHATGYIADRSLDHSPRRSLHPTDGAKCDPVQQTPACGFAHSQAAHDTTGNGSPPRPCLPPGPAPANADTAPSRSWRSPLAPPPPEQERPPTYAEGHTRRIHRCTPRGANTPGVSPKPPQGHKRPLGVFASTPRGWFGRLPPGTETPGALAALPGVLPVRTRGRRCRRPCTFDGRPRPKPAAASAACTTTSRSHP